MAEVPLASIRILCILVDSSIQFVFCEWEDGAQWNYPTWGKCQMRWVTSREYTELCRESWNLIWNKIHNFWHRNLFKREMSAWNWMKRVIMTSLCKNVICIVMWLPKQLYKHVIALDLLVFAGVSSFSASAQWRASRSLQGMGCLINQTCAMVALSSSVYECVCVFHCFLNWL